MTTVFGRFLEASPDEYADATETTYLGYVNGHAARIDADAGGDRGVIVHVAIRARQTAEPEDPKRPSNLFEPVRGDAALTADSRTRRAR